ncbi:SpoIIIAH-like family protein [Coprococcus sp. AF21-14LB]|uniref:SpoIIIAH-like family protein n=1 Tax=Coprococcus sp. AF21-14LB TaxID=2292231 RepID=UPI000E538E78|nr:SpoIIIAH-like family protein [Coprococcus sp. AF21-14LB]QUO33101.1 SpoIIIAH-like family protein [Faecalicatena sp. Marseille-Q4148]RGS82901.1 SpoIIIAH-like family protein [Coprococcus sp. AF21-14LB]
MKKLARKNQIIVTGLALMIAAAGYLNYSGKLFPEKTDTEVSSDLANKELLDLSDEDAALETAEIVSQDGEPEGTPGEAVLTSGIVAEAKIAREQVRAQNKETLSAIIDNANISEAEKQEAIGQLVKMTGIAEKEVAAETLLASKGFQDAVVSLTENSADVVVAQTELTEANRAQILDIVSRKAEIAPEHIVINPVRETKNAEGEEKAEETLEEGTAE